MSAIHVAEDTGAATDSFGSKPSAVTGPPIPYIVGFSSSPTFRTACNCKLLEPSLFKGIVSHYKVLSDRLFLERFDAGVGNRDRTRNTLLGRQILYH